MKTKTYLTLAAVFAVLIISFNNCGRGFEIPGDQESVSQSLQSSNEVPPPTSNPLPDPNPDSTAEPAPEAKPVILSLKSSMNLTGNQVTVEAGNVLNFKLQFTSSATKQNYNIFLHIVNADGSGLIAQTNFVPNPPTSQWNGLHTFQGNLTVPSDLKGHYTLKAGLFVPSTFENIRLSPGSGVSESQDGSYGYRYAVGQLIVTEPPPVTNPNPGTGSSKFTDVILSDMFGPNDGTLHIYHTREASLQMGLMGRGDYTPNYWQPSDPAFKSSAWWDKIAPWWNVYPMKENQASHTLIEIGLGQTFARRKSDGQWILVGSSRDHWAGNYNYNASAWIGDAQSIAVAGGNKAYRMPEAPNTVHGGTGVYPLSPPTIDALVVCIEARLIVDPKTGIDDRDKAFYTMWIGADWYPVGISAGFKQNLHGISWGPGIANSRLVKITKNWRPYCVAPLEGVPRDQGNYRDDGKGIGFPTSILKNTPPPLGGFQPF